MRDMWTLGGLSARELLRRTWRESWRDAVFGQGGRMAFYHFLAIFPVLLILLTLFGHLPLLGPNLKHLVVDVAKEFLPSQTSAVIEQVLGELEQHMPAGTRFLSALAGALWAGLNGTWALIFGLNRAYEVEERRPWWKLAITIVGLTLWLVVAGSITLFLLFFAVQIEAQIFHQPSSLRATFALRGFEWLSILLVMMCSFAIIYRFAPNLRDHEWKWSTPGAVCAMLLWGASTVGVRFYFERINDYTRAYGHLNGVVMLLLWLYLTNAAILIGGEMNSEIEKAAAERPNSDRSGS